MKIVVDQNIKYPYIDTYIYEYHFQFQSSLLHWKNNFVRWVGCVVMGGCQCSLYSNLGTHQCDRWNNTCHLPRWKNSLYIFQVYLCCTSEKDSTGSLFQALLHKKHHAPWEKIILFISLLQFFPCLVNTTSPILVKIVFSFSWSRYPCHDCLLLFLIPLFTLFVVFSAFLIFYSIPHYTIFFIY